MKWKIAKDFSFTQVTHTISGVLNPEELFMINKGFKKAESNQPSSGTQKGVRPRKVSGWNPASSDSDGFHLKTLEGDNFETVKPDIYKLSKRSKVATNNGGPACVQPNALSSKKRYVSSQNTVKSVQALKSENLSQVPKSMTKTRITDHQVIEEKVSSVPRLTSSRQTSNTTVEGSDNVKMEIKTRKAGVGMVSE